LNFSWKKENVKKKVLPKNVLRKQKHWCIYSVLLQVYFDSSTIVWEKLPSPLALALCLSEHRQFLPSSPLRAHFLRHIKHKNHPRVTSHVRQDICTTSKFIFVFVDILPTTGFPRPSVVVVWSFCVHLHKNSSRVKTRPT
jgi:hypothetical protein